MINSIDKIPFVSSLVHNINITMETLETSWCLNVTQDQSTIFLYQNFMHYFIFISFY